jgi:hypothetical protein
MVTRERYGAHASDRYYYGRILSLNVLLPSAIQSLEHFPCTENLSVTISVALRRHRACQISLIPQRIAPPIRANLRGVSGLFHQDQMTVGGFGLSVKD